jgi:tRNA threonylcarbamoyladenosine biosynthesis protein TsaB
MGLILNIETSTKVCSVALAKNGKTVAVKEELGEQYIHSEKLTVFIETLMDSSGYELSDLEAICVSKGPGSYTGLRIGVSCAKGLCYALKIPLLAIDSLTILGSRFVQLSAVENDVILYPMIDARRMEVFTQKMNANLVVESAIEAMVIDEASFSEYSGSVFLFGDGANKLIDTFTTNNIKVLGSIETSARGMEQLSHNKFLAKDFEDVAYFEPYYLKEFIAIPSKKKLL